MTSAVPAGSAGSARLLDLLLDEQQRLTAVERFAQRHARSDPAPLYQDLIPLSAPGVGQQLAFQVDLDRCTGCKACVTACHSLNGLDEGETWRRVGRLVGSAGGVAIQQSVTSTCHHCEDPACLSGCPVKAYDKDPVTGIVRHLDDQCIGCRYCQLTCPYDVPRFNQRLGIVRKCDMCADRLAEGEAPACVQGCPNGAISIRIVERDAGTPARALLPSAPAAAADPLHTLPTTRYLTALGEARLAAADEQRLSPAPAHDPLALMLVAVQAAVGLLLCDIALQLAGASSAPQSAVRWLVASGLTAAGLLASTFHLGRPRYAFRAFLGWRTSWMSREVLALGGFLGALVLAALVAASRAWWPELPLPAAVAALEPLAALLGLATTACSIGIYASTHRRLWGWRRTGARFAGTLLALGCLAAALCSFALAPPPSASARALCALGALVAAGKLALELGFQRRRGEPGELGRSARLLAGPLWPRFRLRIALTLAGALAALLALALPGVAAPAAAAGVALALLAAGEGLERHLFFTAEAARAMPGAG